MLQIKNIKKYKKNNNYYDVSIIIPTKGFLESLAQTIEGILSQKKYPKEIIIVDTSVDNIIEEYIKKLNNDLIVFLKAQNKYPGEARNFGAKIAKSKYLCFLDSKTKPLDNWLENYFSLIELNNLDIIFGSTKYIGKNKKEKNFIASSVGFNPIETTPGSIIKKEIFNNNFFIEKVRTADDLEWRNKLKNKNYKFYTPKIFYLIYSNVSSSLYQNLKRYFIYSFHTARVDVQTKTKTLYLCIFLIFTVIFIPKWNWFLPGWDSHPFYIPNITKIYILSIISFLFIYVIIKNFFVKKIISNLTNFTIQIICIISLFYFLFRFKISVSNTLENFIGFIPHTIQYYLTFLIILSFIFRGIILPLSRGVKTSYLLPFNFINLMFYGFLIDLVKAPGYLIGAIFQIFNIKLKEKKKINEIIFLTKYSSLSASVRHRFLIYKNIIEKNSLKFRLVNMFSDNFFKSKVLYNKIIFSKLIYFYFKRLFFLIFLKKNVLVIIHLELLPYSFSLGERILFFKKIPFIVDLDDPIYYRKEKFYLDSNKNNISVNKSFNFQLNKSKMICAGNKNIKNYVNKFNDNVFILPSIIDLNKYDRNILFNKNKDFTVVWIGSPSTSIYLKQIIPYLKTVYKYNKFKLRLIGSSKIKIEDLDYEILDWNEKDEIKKISECHVGIMPLIDTPWSRGKCGFKLIQYMGCSLPVLASPVGINNFLVKHGENGFLCQSKQDWITNLTLLIQNPNILIPMGIKAKKRVKKHFSLENWEEIYIQQIKNLI